jgi:hypothetical protein
MPASNPTHRSLAEQASSCHRPANWRGMKSSALVVPTSAPST